MLDMTRRAPDLMTHVPSSLIGVDRHLTHQECPLRLGRSTVAWRRSVHQDDRRRIVQKFATPWCFVARFVHRATNAADPARRCRHHTPYPTVAATTVSVSTVRAGWVNHPTNAAHAT